MFGLTLNRLRAQRTQPPCSEPFLRNRKLRPTAIQADPDIRSRSQRGVAQRSWSVAEKTNFCRNYGKSPRLTLWAHHGTHLWDRFPAWGNSNCNLTDIAAQRKLCSFGYLRSKTHQLLTIPHALTQVRWRRRCLRADHAGSSRLPRGIDFMAQDGRTQRPLPLPHWILMPARAVVGKLK